MIPQVLFTPGEKFYRIEKCKRIVSAVYSYFAESAISDGGETENQDANQGTVFSYFESLTIFGN